MAELKSDNSRQSNQDTTNVVPQNVTKRVPYFPPDSCKKNRRYPYAEVVKCLESLGYIIQVTEEEYNKLKNSTKIPALCPLNHGLTHVSIRNLKLGQTCCKLCGFEKGKKTNLAIRGVENPFASQEVKEKIRQTNLNVRGVPYPMQSEEVREKSKLSVIENWGVENVSQHPEIREKVKETNLRNRGVENPMQSEEVRQTHREVMKVNSGYEYALQNPVMKERIKQINLKIRGVEYASQSQEVKDKIRETNKKTNMERWGVENCMQRPEIFQKQQKSAFSRKEYIFPSGRETTIQGYEGFCLDDLIKNENVKEEDIRNEILEMPNIWYEYQNETKRHYPDIYIPDKNLIIEVKSIYTFDIENPKLIAKAFGAIKSGYSYEFRIYDYKGKMVLKIPVNKSPLTKVSQEVLEEMSSSMLELLKEKIEKIKREKSEKLKAKIESLNI